MTKGRWAKWSCVLGILVAFVIPSDGVRAQGTSPFGQGWVGVSEDDRKLASRSLIAVAETGEVGATDEWSNEESGAAGSSIMLEPFERGGVPCAKAEHLYIAGNVKGRRREIVMCKVAEGDWKLAL